MHNTLNFYRKKLAPYIETVDRYINSDDQSRYYSITRRKKKRGGTRELYRCIHPNIRNTHKIIYEILRDYQGKIHPAAHGFVKKRSTLTNAKLHTQQNYILKLDLIDFFDSIKLSQVHDVFKSIGFKDDVAKFFSKLTTVDGFLKQGLHTSPDISNHCLFQVDQEITLYCNKNNLVYSRYGDDMAISGETCPDFKIIKSFINNGGFKINMDKVKTQKRGSNQYITGLTVFDQSPRIPRRFKKNLRLRMYYIEKYGFVDYVQKIEDVYPEYFENKEDFENYLEEKLFVNAKNIIGHVSYLNSIEKDRAKRYWSLLNEQEVKDFI